LAAWGTLAGLCARGSALLVLLVGVAVAAPSLGNERLGVWMALSAAAVLLSALDFGVGNALLNRVAHLQAMGDSAASDAAARAGMVLLGVIGAAVATLVGSSGAALPWPSWLGIKDPVLTAEALQAGPWLAALVGLNIAASGVLRVLAGQQRGHWAHWITCAGSVLALIAVLIVSEGDPGIAHLLFASMGLPSIVVLAMGWWGMRPGRAVSEAKVWFGDWSTVGSPRHLLRDGKWFFALQVCAVLIWSSDGLILAAVQGPGSVAALALAVRLFQLASQPFAAMNNALWPGYAEASARGDEAYLLMTLRRSLWITALGSAACCGVLLVVAQPVLARWSSGTVTVTSGLLMAVASWTMAEAAGHAFGVYLNGRGVVRIQLWVVLAFCAVALPLKFVLGSTWGATGVVGATLIAFVVAEIGLYATVFNAHAFPSRPGRRALQFLYPAPRP
jgi:O-antigen/teichoic acid export membrane protein